MEKNFTQILQEINQKKFHPVYLLHGEEGYFIDKIAQNIENNVLSDSEKSFNQTILYGKETDVSSLINLCKRFPMMANQQVVIVKEAQSLQNLEGLESYFEKPMESTILVLCYKNKSLDKRKKLYKLISKNGMVLLSKKLYDNQIPNWVMNYVSAQNYEIEPKAAVVVSEFLGNELSKIANEIDKLILNLKESKKITIEAIEQFVGVSRNYNIFELQNALGRKDTTEVFKIANYFSNNPKASNFSMVFLIGTLYNFFGKLWMIHHLADRHPGNIAKAIGVNPYFVKDYELAAKNFSLSKVKKSIKILLDYDLKSKGLNSPFTSDGELLKELMFKLLD